MLRKKEPDSHHIAEWNQFDLRQDITYEEQPIQIMDRKIQKLRNKEIPLVLVKWQFHGDSELTWDIVLYERSFFISRYYPGNQ
ncbi:hypothetical protein Scep_014358 [Stephania cephalantha]|uniref:Chromo domain-containing protein n=1 Tax=Stephania cephalantha TaxID=152367 RepID=A0AAP0NZB5_9MAGN